MRRKIAYLLQSATMGGMILPGVAMPGFAASSETQRINKQEIEQYLRYAEGFPANVQVQVDDPKASVFPGLEQISVRLSAGQNSAVRTYYLASENERIISGPIFDMKASPFLANLQLLKEDGAPTSGPRTAPVTIYVYSDFECPYCREEARALRLQIDKQYTSSDRIVFKNFPLEAMHPWARAAAVAGICANKQNRDAFWKLHDWFFEHQKELKPENIGHELDHFAASNGLNADEFSACQQSESANDAVNRDVMEGRELGVIQTPTLFINGRKISGILPPEQLNAYISFELEHQRLQQGGDGAQSTVRAIGK